ncbi:MAG: replicative DNA helicase [Candidatus Competibacteraceae bacterium]|nr:replicative DNA helicase [Candidatus Competibacteraceae bacterium]
MDEKLYSLDAEQAVLGGCLFDGTAYDRVADIIRTDDFALRQHRLIWGAIEQLATDNTSVDIITVEEVLQAQGTVDDAGGLAYLGKLARDVPSAANVEAYARIMADYRIRRGLQTAGHRIAALAHGDTENRVAAAYSELEALHDERKQAPVKAEEALSGLVNEIERRFQMSDDLLGLPTGVGDLDIAINGLCPGLLYVVAGRPGMGKSVLGLQMVLRAAATGAPALLFSIEMGREELMARAAANIGGILKDRLKRPSKFDEDDWAKLTSFLTKTQAMPYWLDDSANLHINDIVVRARRHKRQYGLGLLAIDYLQLIRGTGENRNKEIGSITRACKLLAKELQVPVVLLSQLNRSVEQRANKRPILADLRESGEIEQDADVVIFLYRDEEYYPDTADTGVAELIIAKQRDGVTGTRKAAWLGQYARIEALAFEYMRNQPAAPEREYFA